MPQKKMPRSLAASASSSSSSAVAARVDAAPGRLAAVAMTSSSSSPLVPASARQLRGPGASSHLPLAQRRRARCLLLPISRHCQQDKDSGADGRARCGTSGARCGHGGAQKVDAIKVPSPPPVQPTVSLPNSLALCLTPPTESMELAASSLPSFFLGGSVDPSLSIQMDLVPACPPRSNASLPSSLSSRDYLDRRAWPRLHQTW